MPVCEVELMARIRSIKPTFCQSEAIAALSIPCRLHFAMLWTYADDTGRGLDNPRLIKAALWPLDDDVDVHQIDEWQQELADHGRLTRYVVDGKRYFEVTNFSEHQKPNRPVPSTLPDPSQAEVGALTEPTVRAPERLIPVVVVGEVEVEVEVEGVGAPPTLALEAALDVDALFAKFWESYPKKVAKPDAKRAFAKALKAATVDEISVGLRRHKTSSQWANREYIPHPATWLNRHGWNDDTTESTPAMPKAADTILRWAEGQ